MTCLIGIIIPDRLGPLLWRDALANFDRLIGRPCKPRDRSARHGIDGHRLFMCTADPLLSGQERHIGIVGRPCHRCGRVIEGGIFVGRDVAGPREEGDEAILALELDAIETGSVPAPAAAVSNGAVVTDGRAQPGQLRSASQKWKNADDRPNDAGVE